MKKLLRRYRTQLFFFTGAILLFVSVLFAGDAFYMGPIDLKIIQKTLSIPSLPPELNGIKIVLMSDFHADSNKSDRIMLQQAIAEANHANAELILLLGDYLKDDTELNRSYFFENLGKLKAKYGVYAVLGNHDRYMNTSQITGALEENGIPVLENESRTFLINGKKLHLAGMAENNPEWNLRFVRRKAKEPLIIMTHYPDIYPYVQVPLTLIVAGHTHGGQVLLPLLGNPIVPSKYGQRFLYGLIEEIPGKKMFITAGIGTSTLRIRFNCPPEIVILTLSSKGSQKP